MQAESKSRSVKAIAFAALTVLVVPLVANAESADQAFARGQKLAEAGKIAEAEAAFEVAWAERKAWDIAGNLGLTEAGQGKWEEAAEHLRYALDHIGGLAEPEHKAGLQKRFDEVRKKVGEVKIEAPKGCSIRVNERAVGSTPLGVSVFVSPGEITVVATLDGHINDTTTIRIEASQTRQVSLIPKAIPGALPTGTSSASVEPVEPRPTWPGWLIGGVGVAAGATGGILLGVGHAKLGDAETLGDGIAKSGGSCGAAAEGDCAMIQNDLDSAGTLNTTGVVLGATGGALIVGGIIYLVIPDAAANGTAVVPWINAQEVGLSLGGNF